MTCRPQKIEMTARPDREGKRYYFGTLGSTGTLSLKKGTVFFVFTSEENAEEVQISVPKPKTQFSTVKMSLDDDNNVDRIFINLEKKFDEYGEPYYFAAVRDNVEIPLDEGILLFAFVSKEGREQLQIVRNREDKRAGRYDRDEKEPEVVRRDGSDPHRGSYREVETAYSSYS